MNDWLAILEPTETVTNSGATKITYTQMRVVHAQRVKHSGNRSEEVGEHFPEYRAEFYIRDVHPIEENWRVRHVGGHLYTVTNIIPNIKKGMKTLVCDRVNE